MAGNETAVSSEQELAELPRWPVVAFAARHCDASGTKE